MRALLLLICTCAATLSLCTAVRASERVVVAFGDGASAAERSAARGAVDGTLSFTVGRFQVVDVDDASRAAAALRSEPGVARAFADEPVQLLQATARPAPPNDPRFGDQWGLLNVGQQVLFDAPVGLPGADVRALEAWRWTRGAGAPPLAVIDSGVDFTHPDLAGAAWRNTGEIAGNGVDDDANGFVDDVDGWDFVADRNAVGDANGHGTGVTSIAAARANDGIGMAGIAPEAKVMPLVVSDPDGYGSATDIAAAILYAARNGARVANISLGHPSAYSGELMAEAVTQVPGMLLVVAAGNSANDNDTSPEAMYPCALPAANVVCVAATDARDDLATWSNHGATTVDVAAPGEDGLVAVRARPGRPHTYGWTGGTSLAAPLVSGAAQLLLAARPHLTVTDVCGALVRTGTPVSGLAGKVGSGRRLDAAAALTHVAGALEDPVPRPTLPPTPPSPASSSESPAQTPTTVATPAVGPVSKPTRPTSTRKPKAKTKRKTTSKRKAKKRKSRKRRASVNRRAARRGRRR